MFLWQSIKKKCLFYWLVSGVLWLLVLLFVLLLFRCQRKFHAENCYFILLRFADVCAIYILTCNLVLFICLFCVSYLKLCGWFPFTLDSTRQNATSKPKSKKMRKTIIIGKIHTQLIKLPIIILFAIDIPVTRKAAELWIERLWTARTSQARTMPWSISGQ